MPNIITHKLFAQRVFQQCDKLDIKTMIEKHLQLFYIGSNGPDFLFFYHMQPKDMLKEHSLNHIGSALHAGHVNAFYESAIRTIMQENDPFTRESEIVYLLGHLCHWALDMSVHPYIFYRTGHHTRLSSSYHHRFESMLDAMMLKQLYHMDISEYKCSAICEFDSEMLKAIARIYVPAVKDTLHEEIHVYQLRNALTSWHKIQEYLYDPKQTKSGLLKGFEAVMKQPWLVSGNVIPIKIDETYDILNTQKRTWCHPCDNTITSDASFMEMFDEAVAVALSVWKKAYGCLEYGADLQSLLNEIDDRAYDTGRKGNAEMKYFACIYDEAV